MLVSICSWASLSVPGPRKGSMGSDTEEARQAFSCSFSWILVPYVVTRLLLLGTAEGLLCGAVFLQLTKQQSGMLLAVRRPTGCSRGTRPLLGFCP